MEFLTKEDFIEWLIINHAQIKTNKKMMDLPSDLKGRLKKTSSDQRIAVLSSVNGVSVDNAENLLKRFGSLPRILHSRQTQKALMEVNGIGRTKAKNILSLRDKI